MMELTLRNARLPESPEVLLDIGVREGRVVALAPGLPAGMVDHDLQGRLAVPGFVETHIHLDKACILERCASERGDLSEAISEVARLKAGFTEEDVAARAARALAKCLVNGTMRMRTHVEVDPVIGLRGLEGVKRALRAYAWAMEVEICVFPQEGLLNNPGTEELMIAALRDGAGCVGAAPYTDSDPHGQIDRVFRMARDFDVDIDMHLDFSTDPGELDAEYVCRKTEEAGWGGRVAIGHVSKSASLPAERLEGLCARLAGAGVAVTALPSTDLFLMGRDVDHAVPRGVAPLHRMLGRGVNCSVSTNNLLNPFTPFGDGSLLRAANLFANVAQLGRREELAECLRLVTGRAARLLNLDDYGIVVGGVADLVVLDSADPALAVAELAQPVMGFKAGRPTFTRPLPTIHAPAASAAG
jgi:cytosine deaminase